MTLPSWTVKLAAAAVIPVILGMGVAFSAPSPWASQEVAVDGDYNPGMDGVDFAAVTGPTKSELEQGKSCEDATWPRIPAGCLTGTDDEADKDIRRIRINN